MIVLLNLELAYSSQDWLPIRNEAGMSLAAVQLEKPQALSYLSTNSEVQISTSATVH